MHSRDEYIHLLNRIVEQARQMIYATLEPFSRDCYEVIDFIDQYGCHGRPTDVEGRFSIEHWLVHSGTPERQHDAVTIVPCFHDDTPPMAAKENRISPGVCFYTDQAIVLFNVDQWTLSELALTFLHEARHIRHRLGPRLANLAPLDNNQQHETNTWLFIFNVLAAWGGDPWHRAVEQEVDWLKARQLVTSGKKLIYCKSERYWPELDQVFGPNSHQSSKIFRQALVSLRANILHWAQNMPQVTAEDICHALISHLYA